jgi:hypothetical protein
MRNVQRECGVTANGLMAIFDGLAVSESAR